MANDIVFRKAPLVGPPTVLVFGEPDVGAGTAAYALGHIALPVLAVSGAALATRPPAAHASGGLPLPTFMTAGVVRYDSAVQRPLVGRVASGWQLAGQAQTSADAAHQAVQPLRTSTAARWQPARAASGGAAPGWQDAERVRRAVAARYQEARALAAGTHSSYQDAYRAQTGGTSGWQEAVRVPPAGWHLRYQDVIRMRTAGHVRWQAAVRRQLQRHEPVQRSVRRVAGARSRWQEFMRPPPGASVLVPPQPEPCYEPTTTLVFSDGPLPNNVLVFICKRHTTPPGGETITVPIRRAYIVQNNITLVRVDSGEALEATAFAMSLDADSWTWQWSATLPWSALPIIKRDIRSGPVDILATVNGVQYRLAAENYRRDRRFADAKVQVQGRGRAAMLGAPSSPVLNHQSASARSIAQLMELALTYNGVGIGWGIDFGITDWAVPGGTWNFQGTHIDAVLDIASAAGAIVQPHRTDATLRILPRYPVAPWHWSTIAPDFVLPAAAVSVEGIEYTPKPNYNRVFVAGANTAGVLGQITRAGTAGDSIAPMVTHSLMTHSDGAQQRGLAVLGDTGLQASVSLRLQVLPETGLILPGAMVRYEDGAESHLGLVRSTALDWQRPTLRQTLILETHPEA